MKLRYMAMGDHFVNNTIVNLLHVLSDTGADEMMTIRVSVAQTISFIAVLVWYIRKMSQGDGVPGSFSKNILIS